MFRRLATGLVAAFLAATVALPSVGFAAVYLNGIKIDGVTNQRIERATVRIDDRGDVHIDAPGYEAKVVQGEATPPPAPNAPATLTRRYWLVTEQSVPGMTDYDIDVYVNAKWIRKLRSADEQLVTEITQQLVPGKNSVVLVARKRVTKGGRPSRSADHFFRVIIGEGDAGGDRVMIDNPIVDFRRTAADQGDVTKDFAFTTR